MERRHLVRISLDTGDLQNGTDSAAGNHAGTLGSGLHQHLTGTKFADDFVRNGGSLEGNFNHVLLRIFNALADSVRDFAGFSDTKTNGTISVTHD